MDVLSQEFIVIQKLEISLPMAARKFLRESVREIGELVVLPFKTHKMKTLQENNVLKILIVAGITLWTFERPFLCMEALVCFQLGFTFEFLIALLTSEHTRFIMAMFGQMSTSLKLFITSWAFDRFFFSMEVLVSLE